MKRSTLPKPPVLLFFLLVGLAIIGCGGVGDRTTVDNPSLDTALLEPLPIPSHLDQTDPPVRAQYEALRATLDGLLANSGKQPTVGSPGANDLSRAYGDLGMWHQTYDDHPLAQLAYRHALVHAPDTQQWHYYLGWICGALGDTEAARRHFESFLTQNPDDAPVHVHLAEIEVDAGRSEEARKLLTEALELQPDNPRALTGLGRIELQQRNYEAAAAHLERALQLQPETSRVRYSLGLAYRGLGKSDLAAEHMAAGGIDNREKRDASMVDPLMAEVRALKQGARVHGQRGRRAFVEGDFGRAIEAARQAVAANPETVQPRLNLGAALLRADRPEEAMSELEEVLQLSPGHPIAHFNLGATAYRLGDRGEAEKNYAAAVASNPGFKEARFNLANMVRQRGDYAKALEQYEAVIALDPGLDRAPLWRAVCLVELGRHQAALQTLEKDLSNLRNSRVLQLAYTRLLATSKEPKIRQGERALQLARSLFRARPQLAEAEAVAAAHAERGAFEDAIAWQQAALDAAREQASGPALARLSRRLADYRRGEPCRQMWDADELKGSSLPVTAPSSAGP